MSLVVTLMDKAYDDVQALRGASFEVPDGAVTCLVGPNGAGKTTALKALGGLVQPDGGEVQVDGAPPGTSSFPLGHLGLVLGPDHWVGSRTGFHSLRGLAMTSGVPESRVRQCLEEAGIAAVGDRKVGTYSLGMRQRLSLAAAMLGQARNLVLDEPFNGLDPEGVRWLRALLRSQAEEDRAVLVSSHLLAEVEDIADRVVVLTEGRVLAQARTDDVRRCHRVVVRAADPARVVRLAGSRQWQVEEREGQGTVLIDAGIEEVQRAFSQEGLSFTEMRQASRTLEDWFFHVLEEGGRES